MAETPDITDQELLIGIGRELKRLNAQVATVRSIAVFWLVLTLVGGVLYAVIALSSSNGSSSGF